MGTPEAGRRAGSRAWLELLGLLFASCWVAGALVVRSGPWAAFHVPALLLMGGMATGLDLVLHEAAHGALLRGPTANRWIGFLAGAPGLLSLTAYRHYHGRHHAQSLHVSSREGWMNGTPLYLLAAPSLAWRTGDARRRRDLLVEYALILGAASALVAASLRGGWFDALVDVWLIPLAIGVTLNSVRGWTETIAAFLVRYEDRHGRPPVAERWSGLLTSHLEHHLRPGLPWHALGAYSPSLREDRARTAEGRSYLRFLWGRLEARIEASYRGGSEPEGVA